ncbi:MAG: Ig-like domain-containing protein, partial [Gemmatimonadota bacterium]
MAKTAGSRVPRFVARLAALTGCVLALSYCGEQGRFGGITPPGGDTENPVVTVTFPGGAADTVVDITDSLKFTVRVTDNAQVAAIQVRVAGLGGFTLDTTVLDTTNTTATTDVTRSFTVPLPANAAGQRLAITATAADVTGNTATTTINVVVEDQQPPVITIKQPGSGASVAAGATLTVVVRATDPSGIDSMGVRLFQTRNALGQPRVIADTSKPRYSARVESKTDTFQLTVPDTLNPGTYTVHAFAFDGSPSLNDTTSADVSIQVADTLLPFGTFLNPPQDSQVVAGDSVKLIFRAQDRTGVDSVVFRGFQQKGDSSLGTDVQVARFNGKKATFASAPDSVVVTRFLNAVLADSTPSDSIFLEATVFDVGGNKTTVLRRIRIVAGPFVRVSSPANGSRQPVGVPLAITLIGRDPDSVRILGFIATGVAPGVDTLAVIGAPLQVLDTITRTLTVPATAALGVDTITPFARDRLGNRFFGTPIVVQFEDRQNPTVTINLPNVANFPVTVGDSVRVSVTVQDNRGVTTVGFAGVALRG